MIKRILSFIAIVTTVLMCSNSIHAEKMRIDWCITLLEIKDSVYVPDSVAEPMCSQCAIFQKAAVDEIKRICKIDNVDERQDAANLFNYQHKEEYAIYIQMIRVLKNYMHRKCLGAKAVKMCNDILKTNTEIDKMFTIFRSRMPLPKQ